MKCPTEVFLGARVYLKSSASDLIVLGCLRPFSLFKSDGGDQECPQDSESVGTLKVLDAVSWLNTPVIQARS